MTPVAFEPVSPSGAGAPRSPAGVVPRGGAAAVGPGPATRVQEPLTVAGALVDMLHGLGVSHAFGVSGGAIAPIWTALSQSAIPVLHFRHEAGAAFAAAESYFASGRPAVVFTTTGPGLFNALTGLMAARWEGAKVLLVSAFTSAPQRGRWAFQETSAHTTPIAGLFTPGALFHHAGVVESAAELAAVQRRLAAGLSQPGGFVAHVSVPVALQATPAQAVPATPLLPSAPSASPALADMCAQLLSKGPSAIWVGFGARGAAPAVRRLAERLGAAVLCSPRGKGIFPEDHPQFAGVTGFGGHASVQEHLRARRPERTLVLGTRMGEFTSFYDPALVPPEGFIHVDVDQSVFGAAYPEAPVLPVQAEIGAFVEALLDRLPDCPGPARSGPRPRLRPPPLSPRSGGPVRPEWLMEEIQRVIVEGSDAVVMAEAGNSFAWLTHALRFSEPGRYRVSTGFGSMGQASTGVLGAALGRGGKAVAVVGDGAMLMNNELTTAAQHGIPAVWIVLNDGLYNMCSQGNRFRGFTGVDCSIWSTDFVEVARGMRACAVRVEEEEAVGPALERAMAARGPFVVDVRIDPSCLSPAMRRFAHLKAEDAGPRGVPAFE